MQVALTYTVRLQLCTKSDDNAEMFYKNRRCFILQVVKIAVFKPGTVTSIRTYTAPITITVVITMPCVILFTQIFFIHFSLLLHS